jgi:hypothetical protein
MVSDLPLYQELDDQEFEEFCTDLLNQHPRVLCLRDNMATTRQIIKADRLLSGTDQGGADIYARADQGEKWRLQCKHMQSFNAVEASNAMELAEKGFPLADQFVLITTCGLSDSAQQAIRDRPKWLWWGPSHLTNLVVTLESRKDAENLVDRHFGLGVRKRLLPGSNQPLLDWQQFFADTLSADGKHFHHAVPFIPQPGVFSRLEAFAKNGAGHALILSAPGGQGKSRLLLELAKSLEAKPGTPRVFFVNLSRQGLDRDQVEFLSREPKDLLLMVDDAHRLSATMEDVARAAAAAKSVRLLVATRPEAVAALESQLYASGYAERLEPRIDLTLWKEEDVHQLAEKTLDLQHRHHAARLVALADRCPLLVVLGAAMLNSGEWPEAIKDHAVFRERVFKSLKNDFLSRQPEPQRERLDQLIKLLAFVSPVAKNDIFYNTAAGILGCSALAIGEDIRTLQAARLVIENREGIRLYPDLFSDAVLQEACLDDGGRPSFFHQTVLSKLHIDDFPALMRNVAQADWETRSKTGEAGLLFEPVWQEFVRRFQASRWKKELDWRMELDLYVQHGPESSGLDRAKLLRQWTSFAIYLPEKSVALAELALQTVEEPSAPAAATVASRAEIQSSVSALLPPLLKPVLTWHPLLAEKALDILWSLDADEPKHNLQAGSNAIAVIAEAAGFEAHKPLGTSTAIIGWFEKKLSEDAAIERMRRQPWVLGALLKPLFKREVEQIWSTGDAMHLLSLPLSAEKTRPLRARALAIVERFLNSEDLTLADAVVPVLGGAIHPVLGRHTPEQLEDIQNDWRPERMEGIRILERAVLTRKDATLLLYQLRNILREERRYDPDKVIREECQHVLSAMHDTFELRVVRALASNAYHECIKSSVRASDAELVAAQAEWSKFCEKVTVEIVERFKTPKEACQFISREVRELSAIGASASAGVLLDPLAQISPDWCVRLVDELIGTSDPTLDRYLYFPLGRAATCAPDVYHRVLKSLPASGRPEQLCSLLGYLGWKQLHGGGVSDLEYQCILAACERTEESITIEVASTASLFFAGVPEKAIDLLVRLIPRGERSGSKILEGLAFLVEPQAAALDARKVAQCLANIGRTLLGESDFDGHNVDTVAEKFPKQVYEWIRGLLEHQEAEPETYRSLRLARDLSLRPIGDPAYVDSEIRSLWAQIVALERGSIPQTSRLYLLRSLIYSEPASVSERIRSLVGACGNGEELKLAAEIVATTGSPFVFQFPDLVRLILTRGVDLGVAEAVRQQLWLSACGGGRSYSAGEPDPECRHIIQQGEALANRFQGDALLEKFYGGVAESTRRQIEWDKRAFHEMDERE